MNRKSNELLILAANLLEPRLWRANIAILREPSCCECKLLSGDQTGCRKLIGLVGPGLTSWLSELGIKTVKEKGHTDTLTRRVSDTFERHKSDLASPPHLKPLVQKCVVAESKTKCQSELSKCFVRNPSKEKLRVLAYDIETGITYHGAK